MVLVQRRVGPSLACFYLFLDFVTKEPSLPHAISVKQEWGPQSKPRDKEHPLSTATLLLAWSVSLKSPLLNYVLTMSFGLKL